jgi:hypothetical protein
MARIDYPSTIVLPSDLAVVQDHHSRIKVLEQVGEPGHYEIKIWDDEKSGVDEIIRANAFFIFPVPRSIHKWYLDDAQMTLTTASGSTLRGVVRNITQNRYLIDEDGPIEIIAGEETSFGPDQTSTPRVLLLDNLQVDMNDKIFIGLASADGGGGSGGWGLVGIINFAPWVPNTFDPDA